MPRRVMEGRVVSDKSDKTITVLIERRIMDPVYKKFVRRSKKYAAHDEGNAFRIGDYVKIEECAPISKSKRWKVISQAPANSSERPAKTVGQPKVAPPKKETVKKAARAEAAASAEGAEKPVKTAKPKAAKETKEPKAAKEKASKAKADAKKETDQ